MAISNGRKLVKGSDIMLFTYTGGVYKSIAHSSSHTLSISADVEQIDTKDTGRWGMTEVNKINWEIQAQHFYTNDGYKTFFDYMLAGEPIDVAFGLKSEYDQSTGASNPETVNIDSDGNWSTAYTVSPAPYCGKVIITNLELTSEAGSKAQFSATLQGVGEISYLTAPV